MRYAASALLVLSTGLWLGGIVALAMFAREVFQAFGPDARPTAGLATSAMFVVFAKYQLVLAAIALFAAFLAYLPDRRGIFAGVFALLALGAVGAAVYSLHFVPKMEELRRAGESSGNAFQSMHGQVKSLFQAIMAAVLGGMLLLTKALARNAAVTAPSNE